LPQPLEFPDKWEVALVELFYPHTWSNVSVENSAFDTYTLHNMERRKFKIDDGFYMSIGQIVLALNEQIRLRTQRTKFQFNKFNGHVSLYVGSGEAIRLKNRLAQMLGFERNYFANPGDDTIKPIRFQSGKVIAKLHFRRKRTYLL
jgi:hypothetical protein